MVDQAKLLCAALVSLLLCLPVYAQPEPGPSGDQAALTAATHALCHTQVAMLGESATHGDGHTLAFKVALVERLVDQCGFDRVYFEANHAEFLHLNHRQRSGLPVSPDDLLAAVGGLWKFYAEFQPLAPFLLQRAKAGQLVLGGLDDQFGQLGQDYANVAMIAEWTDLLPVPERQACGTALHRRIFYDYPASTPYSKEDHSQLETCLAQIQTASEADKTNNGLDKDDRRESVSAMQRWIARDFSTATDCPANRDRSLFQSFQWLQRQAPKRHKVIVWAATVHIAKQRDPDWDQPGTNFGALVHREYGAHASSLGFSALTGSYGRSRKQIQQIPPPPADSVEAFASQDGSDGAMYLGPARLAALGTRPGAFFRHTYQTLPWADFLDGVVVFRAEHPPGDLRVK